MSSFSKDTKTFVTASIDQVIKIYSTEAWKILRTIEIPRGFIRALAISPSANHLALGSGTAVRIINF